MYDSSAVHYGNECTFHYSNNFAGIYLDEVLVNIYTLDVNNVGEKRSSMIAARFTETTTVNKSNSSKITQLPAYFGTVLLSVLPAL